MNGNADRRHAAERLPPGEMPPGYYDFAFYVTKERMLTYWHQVDEILRVRPERILEVGIGSRVVSGVLRSFGIETTTADINPALRPDVETPISGLHAHFDEGEFPFVLCARVLQHLPFDEFEQSIRQLHRVTGDHLLLTLPVETLRLYFRFRATGTSSKTLSIPLPLMIKRMIQGRPERRVGPKAQNFWKINQHRGVSMANIKKVLSRYFSIEKAYQVPEDMSHAFFLLRKSESR